MCFCVDLCAISADLFAFVRRISHTLQRTVYLSLGSDYIQSFKRLILSFVSNFVQKKRKLLSQKKTKKKSQDLEKKVKEW